jgi:hypothetical protein
MKTKLLAFIVAASMLLAGCDNDKVIDGKHYETFGVANEETHRDPNIQYELSASSVIWAIILCETIVVPVYIIGWDLYQPVKAKVVSK